MAKISRVLSTRSARLDASSGSYSGRFPLRQNSSTTPTQASRRPPLTPSEFFMHLVLGNEKDTGLDANACPGANVQILLKLHVEETYHTTSTISPVYVLILCVETHLPTGGTHTARLDSWKKDAARPPAWLAGMQDSHSSPLHLYRTLGWLHTIVSAIESRPTRCEGDVWSRFLLFINNVKEAYRVAPPLETGTCARPRPRPRPRYAGLGKLVDGMAMLRLSDDDRQDACGEI